MTKAMHGGLALLSALPERFTAAVKSGSLLLRWMPGLGHLSPARNAVGFKAHQRLSVLLPERFDSGLGYLRLRRCGTILVASTLS